jgi:hypothetical protein
MMVTFPVGVAAAAVAWQSRNIAAASIVPFLHVRENILNDKLVCTIVNWGLGPAVVQGMQMTYPRVPRILGAAADFGNSLVQLEESIQGETQFRSCTSSSFACMRAEGRQQMHFL